MDWQLQTDRAALETGHWQVSVDPRDPRTGLHVRHLSVDFGYVFSIVPKPSHSFHIQEAYVRENDLIVRYEQSGDDLYTFQLNWRRLECDIPDALAIELWISIQTSLLDTHPVIDVHTRATKSRWSALTLNDISAEASDATAVGVVSKAGLTSLVMIPSSDAHQAQRLFEGDDVFSLRLFGEFMEKGVIRRGRLCFIAAPGEFCDSAIARQYQLFEDSPLPLTA